MTRGLRSTLFVCVCTILGTLGLPATSQAQGFIAPLIGYNFGGDSGCAEIRDCEDKTLNLGVAFGRLGGIGFEQEIAWARNFYGEAPGLESSVLTVMSNPMVAPRFGPVRPYGLVGLRLIKSRVELTTDSLLDFNNNNFGWDLGGGVIVGGAHVGIRGDIRYFHSFQDLEIAGIPLGEGTKLDFGRASAALVFSF